MKKFTLLLLAAVTLVLVSCMSTMPTKPVMPSKPVMPVKNAIYNIPWELEYITGPRIAFGGLFPNKKPQITFNALAKSVSGNDGCNGYATSFTMTGNQISFGVPENSTMMFCGEGEKIFRSTMSKINKYRMEPDGKLTLMMNNVPMMRFRKAVYQ